LFLKKGFNENFHDQFLSLPAPTLQTRYFPLKFANELHVVKIHTGPAFSRLDRLLPVRPCDQGIPCSVVAKLSVTRGPQ